MELQRKFSERMQDNSRSSSSLSPIPSPPAHGHSNGFPDTIAVAHPHFDAQKPEGVVPDVAATPAAANAKNTTSAEKPKKPRKKKEPVNPDAQSKAEDKPKEKKPRKPRTSNSNVAPSASRKKQKTGEMPMEGMSSRQPTLMEVVGNAQAPPGPHALRFEQMEAKVQPRGSLGPTFTSSASRPATSGQRYDPIRGMTMDDTPAPIATPPPQASPHLQRASASPAVGSLVEAFGPNSFTGRKFSAGEADLPRDAASPQPSNMMNASSQFVGRQAEVLDVLSTITAPPPAPTATDTAMEVDLVREPPKLQPAQAVKHEETPAVATATATTSKAASSAATPKAQRPSPPSNRPPPPGSGLLSSSDLFGGPQNPDDKRTRHGVDIDIRIVLNPAGGNTINIASEIMKKYGRDAINPRAAAHRERLLQVAAAANRLEQGSGDDMSVDMSDGENDSNVEMGGTGEGTVGNGDKPAKRPRARKTEDYDKEDDFIDDTEMAWEEQAAVAKDGFFVYQGPLVAEGEKAAVESLTPTTRGRGRGRGRGARATTGTTASTTHASLAAKTASTPTSTEASAATGTATPAAGTTNARGRGRGGRGTGAPRKPRATKADKERLESVKVEKDKAGQGTGAGSAEKTTGTPAAAVAAAAATPAGAGVGIGPGAVAGIGPATGVNIGPVAPTAPTSPAAGVA